MSINAQKYLVGFLGLALLGSVLLAGYQDSKNRKRENPPPAAAKPVLGPELQAGLKVYQEFSCIVCHGEGGNRGAHNFNAQTSQQVPPINHVADSYTRAELIAKIRNGVPVEPKLDPSGPSPPLNMPAFSSLISDQQMQDLIIYLYSLKPKGEELNF